MLIRRKKISGENTMESASGETSMSTTGQGIIKN